MDFKADLHCHSSFSDGDLSPYEIINLAKENNLSGISITDHNNIDAYTDKIFEFSKSLGIYLLPGVEFSCSYNNRSLHVLGYNYFVNASLIKDFCIEHKKRRIERNLKILSNLRKHGINIEEDELYFKRDKNNIVGRMHIAEIMVKKGYVGNIRQAFNQFLGENKCCYHPGRMFSVEETIEIIHRCEGKAFIAHPGLIKEKIVLKGVLGMDFDGIECYYNNTVLSQEKKWLNLAKEKNLLISGGSDFHGENKPHIKLGCSWIDKKNFDKIVNPK